MKHSIPHPRPAGGTLSALVALFLLIAGGSGSSGQRLAFRSLTQKDGLSNDRVTSVAQDRRGFIWIGTSNGLNRYDGYGFTQFHANPSDSSSLSSNAVECLLVDRAGTLWIGTATGGLNRFDEKTLAFARYRADPEKENTLCDNRIRCLFEDSKGMLWIGTYGGLNAFDPSKRSFERFPVRQDNPGALANGNIACIAEDAAGTLWIGTAGGLHAYDRNAKSFRRFRMFDGGGGIGAPEYITSILPDAEGKLWIGTLNGEVIRFDPRTGATMRLALGEMKSGTLLAEPAVSALYRDAGSTLWIGIKGNGLLAYDERTGAIDRYRNDPANPQSLGHNDVTCIHADNGRLLWIGTLGSGVNLAEHRIRIFAHIFTAPGVPPQGLHVSGFAETPEGRLYVGTIDRGLFFFDSASGALSDVLDLMQPGGAPAGGISSLAADGEGTLCIGTNSGGVVLYDPATRQTRRFPADPGKPDALSSNDITAVACARNGLFWIGTRGGGLNSFDKRTGLFTRYRTSAQSTATIGSDHATAIFEDSKGRLWIGTFDAGISLLDPATGTARRFRHLPQDKSSLAGDYVSAICEDRKGYIWIGTNAGISRLDPSSGRCISFTDQDGLSSSVVYGLLLDGDGDLWASTRDGLCEFLLSRFDPADPGASGNRDAARSRFLRFDLADGLQDKKFNQGACLRSRTGTLYFGGINGFNLFDPHTIRDTREAPPVVITDFLLFNVSQKPSKSGYLTEPASMIEHITLPFHQNVLSFEFAVLHFANPEKNRYAYILEGFDRKWNYTNANRRFVTYTNLEPGDYVFRVIGCDDEGIWNSVGARIMITVTPPWWRTIWAYIGYVLVLAGGVLGFIRYQRIRVITMERERAENERRELERQKAKELEIAYNELEVSHKNLQETQEQLIHAEKMASLGQLTAGIAHEIKNPLNFVNNFSFLTLGLIKELEEELDANPEKPVGDVKQNLGEILTDIRTNAEKINHHGKRADGIVRSMLLHSSGKTGEPQPTDVNALIEDAVNLAYHAARAANLNVNVQFETHYDSSIGTLPIIPQEMTRVFLNIIQNAIFVVSEKARTADKAYIPTIAIRTERLEQTVRISIRDNGGGMPEEVRTKIFQPFFTTKPAGVGTGLGLSISYDIVVNGHHGALDVESTPGEGATFIIALPLKG